MERIEHALTNLSQEQIRLVVSAVDSTHRAGTANLDGFTKPMLTAYKIALAKKSNGSLYGYQRRRISGNSDY